MGTNFLKEVFEWVQAIVVAFVVAMFLRTFVFTLVVVDGGSMMPTLHDRERMVVSRFNNESYEYGDVVIFYPECENHQKIYVKRIIATEGQTVSFDYAKGVVEVDGKALEEAYIAETIDPLHFGYFNAAEDTTVKVPEGCYFVMGDNRNNSSDSRNPGVGMVKHEDIIGKAVLRFWPLDSFGTAFKIEK